MLRSPSLSSISLLAVVLLAGCSGDDDTCGAGEAPVSGVSLLVGGETVIYGSFTASENNDCTIQGSGVISVSIHGSQLGGNGSFTLCLPRPDLIGADWVPLVPSRVPPLETDRAMIIDTSGEVAGCTFQKDLAVQPAAMVRFAGYCDGGAGDYAIEVAGTAPLSRTCGADTTAVGGSLAGGLVAVDVL